MAELLRNESNMFTIIVDNQICLNLEDLLERAGRKTIIRLRCGPGCER